MLLESSRQVRFNKIYIIIFILKLWKILNFVVENSKKLQQIGFRMENDLSVFTLEANNTCYLVYP
jgi:hypothetical protein